MIIRISKRQGSVLMTTLMTTGVIGFMLASYLALVSTQNATVMRSLTWNKAIPVSEAGIEEALTQINFNGTNRVANNGWTAVNGSYHMKARLLSSDYSYVTGIYLTEPPIIVSEGNVRLPASTNTVHRTVRVNTRLVSLFAKGMVAREKIDLKGNDITADSFDSSDPNYSTNGLYIVSKRKDNGTIAINSTATNAFNVGNADIRGKIATGPGGVPSFGPNSVVGNNAWHAGGNKGLQPGAFSDDMNVSFYKIDAPFASALPPSSGTVDGTNYTYILGSGNYMISSPKKLTGKVLITGKARLLVTSDVFFSGPDYMYIQPGASLELYVSAPSASIGGLGIQNATGLAQNFVYYGLPSNTSLTFSGNAAFTGAIYAPDADFTLGGGGQNVVDFVGACVTKTITMNGKFNFHFDENIERSGPNRGYIATSWDEITVTWNIIQANYLTVDQLY